MNNDKLKQSNSFNCEDKKTFINEKEAGARCKKINKANHKAKDEVILRPYKCTVCKKWHLTSMSAHKFGWKFKREEMLEKAKDRRVEKEAAFWMKKFGIED